MTACIGVALSPTDGQDVTTLLERAHHALSLAKKSEKHSYQFYREEMHVNNQRELTLHTDISRETVFQELSLYYQPIMDIEKSSIAGVETKMRWNHPELGVIESTELYQLAIKQHKLNSFTEWMLRTACLKYQQWQSSDFSPAFLSLPISFKQLESSHFIYRISQILQALDFNPECLVFDIQDSDYSGSFDILEKGFNMLHYLRIKIALDHFGSDIISLRYLKNFPISYLKIDESLVANLEAEPTSLALIKSLLFLAKNLSMEVIIQGVTSKQQLEVLKDLGCTLMGGPLLDARLPEIATPLVPLT